MSVLLEGKTFIRFFKLDPKRETDGLSDEAIFKWLLWHHTEITEALREWAKGKYPDAPENYKNSFASLIACLATGAYGGYPTENSQKERYAEHKVYDFYRNMLGILKKEEMTIAIIYFVASHLLQKSPLEEDTEEKLQEAIRLLEVSKSSFKSKQIAKARKLLEEI